MYITHQLYYVQVSTVADNVQSMLHGTKVPKDPGNPSIPLHPKVYETTKYIIGPCTVVGHKVFVA